MIKFILYPALLVFALSLHLVLAQTFPQQVLFVPMGVSFVMIFVVFLLERWRPHLPDWNRNLGDFSTDLVQTLVVLPIAAKVVELGMLHLKGRIGIDVWPHHLPWAAQLILAILAAEFLFYWIHRWSHTNPWLWKFHAVHHGAHRVYWANSGRFHVVDLLIQFALYFLPIYLLGAPAEITAVFLTLNAVTGLLEHANIEIQTITISRIFNTAELHRAHHANEAAIANNNYGKILSVWDTIFGTYKKPRTRAEDQRVGLFNGHHPVPHSLIGQLQYPFQKKKPPGQ